MAIPIDLTKKSEIVGITLEKKGLRKAPVMRVGLGVDSSYSMKPHIESDRVQLTFNQMMGVSVKLDDNGELDVFKFSDVTKYLGTSTPNAGDYDRFVRSKGIVPDRGTQYAPLVNEAVKFFFEPKKSGGFLGFGAKNKVNNMAALMIILTDGEPQDKRQAFQAFQDASSFPIYFQFVGVGGSGRSSFPTISELADAFSNVGEVYIRDFNMPDQAIYDQLISDELVTFLGQHTNG